MTIKFSIFPIKILQLVSVFSPLPLFPPLIFSSTSPVPQRVPLFATGCWDRVTLGGKEAYEIEKRRAVICDDDRVGRMEVFLCTNHPNTQWLKKAIIDYSLGGCGLPGVWSTWTRLVRGCFCSTCLSSSSWN